MKQNTSLLTYIRTFIGVCAAATAVFSVAPSALAAPLASPSPAATASQVPASIQHLQERMRRDAQSVTSLQDLNNLPQPKLPPMALHTEYVVETNAKGQVTKVRSGKTSRDDFFNIQTYGNALQAFVRSESGAAYAGIYRLTYDYSPQTHRVRRDVQPISMGGVDPNALGAVYRMACRNGQHGGDACTATPAPGK